MLIRHGDLKIWTRPGFRSRTSDPTSWSKIKKVSHNYSMNSTTASWNAPSRQRRISSTPFPGYLNVSTKLLDTLRLTYSDSFYRPTQGTVTNLWIFFQKISMIITRYDQWYAIRYNSLFRAIKLSRTIPSYSRQLSYTQIRYLVQEFHLDIRLLAEAAHQEPNVEFM